MNTAIKVAVEEFPNGKLDGELGDTLRAACAIGYMRAEKDLALTPDDIKLIIKIHYEIVFKDTTGVKVGDVPSEVLRRFNEQRKEK